MRNGYSEKVRTAFDELRKINVEGAPISIQRIHLSAIENATAVQRAMLDLLRGIPGKDTGSPEKN